MSGERILIADDEPQMRRALSTTLSGHGYDVVLAEDGQQALELVAARPPDLIILDIVMPRIDGIEVLRQVRDWSQLPIIVLSARGAEQMKVTALDLGADDYLTKPFGVEELLARVRAVSRRAGTSSTSEVHFGDIEMDLVAHVVWKRGQEIHLTPTEFDVLRVLAANAGRLLTHRQIIERVWGVYAAENSGQLRVYINYLRRKLEDDPTRPQWIVTDPGIGYRLRVDE